MNAESQINIEILSQTLKGGEAIAKALEVLAKDPNCPKDVIRELASSIGTLYSLGGEATKKIVDGVRQEYHHQ